VGDSARRCAAIIVGILAGYFLLHVLRSFAIASEARGICGGVAGYMVGDLIATPRRGRRKR
jgi:hypothetical protein